MKKICIVTHGLGANGIDTFVKNIVIALDKKEFDVTVLMAVDNGGAEQFHESLVKECGVKVDRLTDLDGLKKKLKFYKVLKNKLKQLGPFDVLHANMDMFNGVVLKAGKTVKIPLRIAHSHVSGSQRDLKSKQDFISKTYKKIMRSMIWKNSNVRLGCSAGAMNWLYQNKWINDANSIIFYNPVEMKNSFANEKENKIFTVGRCVEVKNPFFVIDVIYKLSQMRKDFVFYWVGGGPLLDKVKERVQELKIEDFFVCLGTRGDVLDVIESGKIFLQPSIFEGFGIALVEAQSVGLNCIASTNVPKETDCGLVEYLPIDDAELWANRCNKLLNEEPKLPNAENLAQFKIENVVDKLSKIYKGEL